MSACTPGNLGNATSSLCISCNTSSQTAQQLLLHCLGLMPMCMLLQAIISMQPCLSFWKVLSACPASCPSQHMSKLLWWPTPPAIKALSNSLALETMGCLAPSALIEAQYHPTSRAACLVAAHPVHHPCHQVGAGHLQGGKCLHHVQGKVRLP